MRALQAPLVPAVVRKDNFFDPFAALKSAALPPHFPLRLGSGSTPLATPADQSRASSPPDEIHVWWGPRLPGTPDSGRGFDLKPGALRFQVADFRECFRPCFEGEDMVT